MPPNKRYILISVTGTDRPGITSALMNIIDKNGHQVCDIGQSVTHGLLSLSILIDQAQDEGPVLKDLLFESKSLGIELDFEVVENGLENLLEKETFILSCVAEHTITAKFLANISTCLAKNDINIRRIDKVSRSFNCVEISTDAPKKTNWDTLKAQLIEISDQHKIDVAFLKDSVFRRNKRLIVFDMDSTLIQTEVIDELADEAGAGEQVRKITEDAMNGKINFDESLTQRVALLKGLDENVLQKVLERIPFTSGVEEFVKTVKSLGYKLAIISGGFTFFSDAIKEKLALDYSFSNQLEIRDGKLTGKIKGVLVNPNQKATILELLAQQENISLQQVVAIGDGANDLPMLSKAGLGIAFHAKEIVKKRADHSMSHGPMTSILYFLGITDRD